MISQLIALVAPYLCSSCGAEGALFCENCKSYIIPAASDACLVCGRVKTAPLCGSCRKIINRIYIVGARKGGWRVLIDGYKFSYQRAAAGVLAELMSPMVPAEVVIVPVPTARSHIRQRGYDHTGLLAEILSKRTGRPVRRLLMTDTTLTQHFASRRQRYEQAGSLFQAVGTLDPDARYLIVDDIVTTGSTLLAAARALRAAGAVRVEALVAARQPLD